MAPLAALAAAFVWRMRADKSVAFLLAWIVPVWLLFEAVPTKLPHYVLPVYPAIAILIFMALERGGLVLNRRFSRPVLLLVPGLAFLLVAAGIGICMWLQYSARH